MEGSFQSAGSRGIHFCVTSHSFDTLSGSSFLSSDAIAFRNRACIDLTCLSVLFSFFSSASSSSFDVGGGGIFAIRAALSLAPESMSPIISFSVQYQSGISAVLIKNFQS
jgi:hypothetical protein